LSHGELLKLGEQCSMTERLAQDAERELIKVKLLNYLKDRIGEELNATITGVERFGFFCQGTELPAEGLVHVRSLPFDQWDYDDRGHALIGRRSGAMFRLGDDVRVAVNRVDVDKRTLDFRLAGKANGKRGKGEVGRRKEERRRSSRRRS
jgi:ribonuclease R